MTHNSLDQTVQAVLPNSTSRELCVMDTVSRLDILNINFDPGILETQWVMKSVSTAANVNKAVDSVMGAGLDTTGNPEDQDSDQNVPAKMAEEVVLVDPILVIGAGLVNTTGNPEDQDSAPDAHHQDSAQSSVTHSLTSSSDILNI